jgi:hypothetical protein
MLASQLPGHDLGLSLGYVTECLRHLDSKEWNERQRRTHAEVEPAALDGQVRNFLGHFQHSRSVPAKWPETAHCGKDVGMTCGLGSQKRRGLQRFPYEGRNGSRCWRSGRDSNPRPPA